MGSIIFWASMVITNSVNAKLWKDEPTSFWYKSAWFFIGLSTYATIDAIVEYI